MTKNVAVFQKDSIERLLEAMRLAGYTIRHPGTHDVRGWKDGEMLTLSTEQAALPFLLEGHLLQLWRSEGEDACIQVSDSCPILSFDGFSAAEERALTAKLRHAGLVFDVMHEDEV